MAAVAAAAGVESRKQGGGRAVRHQQLRRPTLNLAVVGKVQFATDSGQLELWILHGADTCRQRHRHGAVQGAIGLPQSGVPEYVDSASKYASVPLTVRSEGSLNCGSCVPKGVVVLASKDVVVRPLVMYTWPA